MQRLHFCLQLLCVRKATGAGGAEVLSRKWARAQRRAGLNRERRIRGLPISGWECKLGAPGRLPSVIDLTELNPAARERPAAEQDVSWRQPPCG
jgi:hypothetical protein